MKIGTYVRLLLCFFILGACSRNPLGEDLKQPILNLGFTLSQNCTNSFDQDIAYSCQINTSDVVENVSFILDPIGTSCLWATLNPATGLVTGTPGDNQVGSCTVALYATNTMRTSPNYTYTIQVNNVQPTLTIADANPILQGDPLTLIRNDAAVQSSEEGFGVYSLNPSVTPGPIPSCNLNATSLTIDANTGAVSFEPAPAFVGTCLIRVEFDDQNGVANSVVWDEFTIAVFDTNDAPILGAIGNQTTNEDVPLTINFTITDVDQALNCVTSMSAVSTNGALVPVGNIVFGGTAPNCTATVTPTANNYGTSTVTFTVTDTGIPVLTDAETFTITVNSVNDDPVLSAIGNQTVNEDGVLNLNFTITDVDSTLNCATSLSASSANIALIPNANIVFGGTAPNCTATITPLPNQFGAGNITITLSDGGVPLGIDSETINVTVNAVNDPPILSAIGNQNINEDGVLNLNFTITDVDSVLDCSTSMSIVSSNTALVPNGNIVLSGAAPNCSVTVTPVADGFGATNLTFTLSDGGTPNLTDTETINLAVNSVNDAPILSAIGNQTTNEDTPLVIPFTITDVDSTLDCSTSMAASSSNTGVIPVANIVFSGTAPNCSVTITPSLNSGGASNVTFTLSDSGAPILTDFETFSVTVNPVNDAPVLSAIGNRLTSEDTPLVINFNITDVDSIMNCSTSISASSSNTGLVPVANIVFGGTAPNCTATVTPVADGFGASNLTFTVTDSGLPIETDFETFTFTVNAVNDAPTLGAIGNQTMEENDTLTVNFTVDDVDSVLFCSGLNLSAVSSDTGLMPTAAIVFSGTVPNCSATFTPTANTYGTSNITITLNDNGAPNLLDSETFVLTVTEFNDPPVLSAIGNQTLNEDGTLNVNFTITDIDNVLDCSSSMSVLSNNLTLFPPGSVVFSGTAPNCTVTLTPAANQFGSADLTMTVTDTGTPVKNDFETITVTVNSVNDAPILGAIGNRSTNEDVPLSINFTINDVETALDCSSSVSASSTNAGLVPPANVVFSGTAPNCTATVTPVANAFGSTNLTFTLTDGGAPILTDFETFNFTVVAVNDAPILGAVGNQTTNEDVPLNFNFIVDDVDSVLDCSTSLSVSSSNPALIPVVNVAFSGTVPNCTATVTPVAGASGSSNLTITLSDSGMPILTDNETITFNVTAVNDAPILGAIGNRSTNEDVPLAINFTITDEDSTLDCATSLTAASTNTALVPVANVVFSGTAPNCTATVTPSLNAFGATNLTITVSDSGMPILTDFETFTFTVNAVNDAPVLGAIGNQLTNEDTPLAINFTITDVDSVLDCATSINASSTNAGLIPVGNIVFSGTAPNCTATVTPVADAFGATNLTFTLSDSGMPIETDFETFTFTVSAVNDAPILSAIGNRNVNEDNALVINYTITDVDSALNCVSSMSASSSTPSLIDAADIVFAGAAPNCTATINPKLNQNGAVNLTIRVTDSGALFDEETFTVTVNPINDAPTISNIADTSINEDVALGPIAFTIGDIDTVLLCSALNVTALSSNTAVIDNADIVIGGAYPNCTVSAVPQLNASGSTTITVTVNDNEAPNLMASDSFVVTVNAVNDAPTISNVADQSINEETSTGALNFTINDIETGGSLDCSTSVSVNSSNTTVIPLGSIILGGTAPNCTVEVAPPIDQYGGPVTITLTLTDNGSPLPTQQAIETFDVTVVNVNDPPIISAIADDDTDEDVPYIVNFTITDSDNNLNCVSSMSASSTNTTVVPNANIVFSGTAPNCTATITPAANQFGISTIQFTVSDGALSANESFDLTVNQTDDPPTISVINDVTLWEDNAANGTNPITVSLPYVINFTINDQDSALTCAGSMSATSSNAALVPVGNIVFSGTAPNCTATITSVNNSNGTSNIVFTVTDGVSNVTEAFTMVYTAVDDHPTISGIANQTISEDQTFVVNFTINDVDSPLSCALGPLTPNPFLLRQSLNVALISNNDIVFSGTAPNCSATITPLLNATGSGTIFIRVNDGSGPSTSTSFSVTVNAVNDNPTISSISNTSFSAGVPTPINFTISDVDNTLNCVSSMSAVSSDQAVVPNANIVFSGTAPNCTATVTAITTGSTNITYTVSDGAGGTASTSNTVNALNAGQETISQTYSTVTISANSFINDSSAVIVPNEELIVKVSLRDTNNNPAGPGHWVVIQRANDGTSNGSLSAVVDNGDGTYSARFVGQTAGTPRSFNAFVNGYPILSTKPKVTVSTTAPSCLSYKNVGASTSGVYVIDPDGDSGSTSSFQVYCDMVTQGGGWTLAASPTKGVAPFNEAGGYTNPDLTGSLRNSNIWDPSSRFKFSQVRLTDDTAATNYSIARFNKSYTLYNLMTERTNYSQSAVLAGDTGVNSQISSNIGSTCFIFRGKSANVEGWSVDADYIFMGFHAEAGCLQPQEAGNSWDTDSGIKQWLISGTSSGGNQSGPESPNNAVGRNINSLDWQNQNTRTIIWFK